MQIKDRIVSVLASESTRREAEAVRDAVFKDCVDVSIARGTHRSYVTLCFKTAEAADTFAEAYEQSKEKQDA